VAFSLDPHLSEPGAIVVGDFNNDGKLDVAVGNGSGIDVYLGKGDGSFEKPIHHSESFRPTFMVAADVNNDGKLDLLVAETRPFVSVEVLLGDGTGRFARKSGAPGYNDYGGFLAVGDLNGDGNLDFVVSGAIGGYGSNEVYLGKGDGTFTHGSTVGEGFGVPVLADFDGDGNLDLAVPDGMNGDTKVDVCFGNGNGTFQACSQYDTGLSTVVWAVAAADVNGDGKLDLITDGFAGVVILLNNGDGTFSQGETIPLGGLAGEFNPITTGDMNGDGKLDVVLKNVNYTASQQSVVVLLGNGDGTFRNTIEFQAGSPGQKHLGLAVGDFDGTGKLGVVVAGNQTLVLLQK
jgi:hypothetical protein